MRASFDIMCAIVLASFHDYVCGTNTILDAIPIKWLVLALFYAGLAFAAGKGTVFGFSLPFSPDQTQLIAVGGAAMAFIGLIFLERNVFYYSFRLIGVLCLGRIGSGSAIFYVFFVPPVVAGETIRFARAIGPMEMVFYGSCVLYLVCQVAARGMQRREAQFVKLEQ